MFFRCALNVFFSFFVICLLFRGVALALSSCGFDSTDIDTSVIDCYIAEHSVPPLGSCKTTTEMPPTIEMQPRQQQKKPPTQKTRRKRQRTKAPALEN
ncbi:hypothetical protein niasHS_012904 [Heterodera schachtii]|uniref:Secreted protein n=1 Tax=Heterodera schachtii TaxID=97005 RepID=A0ABD2IBM3_HETSC